MIARGEFGNDAPVGPVDLHLPLHDARENLAAMPDHRAGHLIARTLDTENVHEIAITHEIPDLER